MKLYEDKKSHRYSTSGAIINETIEFIKRFKMPAYVDLLVRYIEARGINLSDIKNKSGYVSAILTNETRRKYARLVRIKRGVYDLKYDSQSGKPNDILSRTKKQRA
jgi:hypothetical protein